MHKSRNFLKAQLNTRELPEEKAEEKIYEKTEVTEEEEDKSVSLSPMEVLQTRVFYKIWLGQFAIALAQVIQQRFI